MTKKYLDGLTYREDVANAKARVVRNTALLFLGAAPLFAAVLVPSLWMARELIASSGGPEANPAWFVAIADAPPAAALLVVVLLASIVTLRASRDIALLAACDVTDKWPERAAETA